MPRLSGVSSQKQNLSVPRKNGKSEVQMARVGIQSMKKMSVVVVLVNFGRPVRHGEYLLDLAAEIVLPRIEDKGK